MKRLFTAAIFFILFVTTGVTQERAIVVKIGGYDFPPFVENEGNEGIVRDLITKLNHSQSKYQFKFIYTSANRRYKDFNARKFDIILFEDEVWGWKKHRIKYHPTNVLGKGEELVVAMKYNRNQSYFNNLAEKKVRVVLGFHDNMFETEGDTKTSIKRKIEYGRSYRENMNDLLDKKIDITYVSSIYLKKMISHNNDLKKQLIISHKADHQYTLRGLVHPESPVGVKDLEELGMNKILMVSEQLN